MLVRTGDYALDLVSRSRIAGTSGRSNVTSFMLKQKFHIVATVGGSGYLSAFFDDMIAECR